MTTSVPERILIKRGAEAEIYQYGNTIIKKRVPKDYRLAELDKLINKSRTKKETKIIKKLNELNIETPKFIESSSFEIVTERIMNSITAKEFLLKFSNDKNLVSSVMKFIGMIVRKIHNSKIVHGDLTTLNFLVQQSEAISNDSEMSANVSKLNLSNDINLKVYVIDFGLSFHTVRLEDFAVDLYLFEKALDCIHELSLLEYFYEGYFSLGASNLLMEKLGEVRKRGRKKE